MARNIPDRISTLKPEINACWYVYLLQCSDQTIYTGITNDVEARILKHNSGKGAKYTRGRVPVILKAVFEYKNRSEATKAESKIQKLTREEKLRLIDHP